MNKSSPELTDCVSALEYIAGQYPEKTAIVDGDTFTSYKDLQASIERRSAVLLAAGLKPGYRVALVAESSADYLSTALAVWRSGGVLVTVYPSSGPEDLEYSIATSDPALIVISESVDRAHIAPAARNAPIVDIVGFQVTEVRHDALPNPEGLREPLSMICFSSGTTSRPKAIMLSAAAVYNCAKTYGEVWHLSPDDKAIICLPMAWLYGLASTSLAVLVSGGTVVIVRRARPDMIAPAIEEHSATFLAGVTATFGKLAQYAELRAGDKPAFPSLRLCISGGEPRNEAAFSRWQAQTGLPVLDAYCASECLPLVTYDPVANPTPQPGSAGKLVPRSKLKVLDADGAEVPTGQVGEAYSTGPGLMLGYWRDEEQTRTVITEDGWYRTKDLVRVDEDGFVYVVGRLSDVIIRGGTNISPAEVERVLQQHASVGEVAVVGLPDDVYGQRVVAAVVPRGLAPLDEAELKEFAAARLSSYKVPSEFIAVDSLPVNSTTGKVNRRDVATLLTTEMSQGRA
ncbi:class I adenylate-forming enzyme family protein [Arthrobacter sp. ISL-65]|uniref:class I adenylate-forming enzyme family protein n=1 Tax=Arthrobacter sp. ISL-65 TaxID=2819112 RepID=UPI001BE5D694|nr:class I adenylate-forming enzyme family protein [Arthrobacter sp. ISL-65]MBT2550242.1 acyl--CoA ligase [Arthrobacter sp. ISL-65]